MGWEDVQGQNRSRTHPRPQEKGSLLRSENSHAREAEADAADGKRRGAEDTELVERLDRVASVDVVVIPLPNPCSTKQERP